MKDGMQIDKGRTFVVDVPQTCTYPFGTPAGKTACINQLKAKGYDFSDNPTLLNSLFKVKKI